ncbi:cytidine deaminase [Aurantivibrio plasticivorans]
MNLQSEIHEKLFDAAARLVNERYPSGSGGAAAVATSRGSILTSVSPDTEHDALSLCMEVGAFLEACKLNENVTHSLCIYRESPESDFIVLTACGICQERLAYWGGEVEVAISNPENQLIFKPLRELMPHHWSQVNEKKS